MASERLRATATDFHEESGSNYFTTLASAHAALGLSYTLGNVTVMASLVPQRAHEFLFFAPAHGDDFTRLLYFVLRSLMDDMVSLSGRTIMIMIMMVMIEREREREREQVSRGNTHLT